MSAVKLSNLPRRGSLPTARSPSSKLLSTLVYRSRAVVPLAQDDLHRLVQAAQQRNRAESVTGLLICEDDRFFQWLEGPTDSLARIWRAIRQDARHTDIEILGDAPTPVRFFGDWSMRLATRESKGVDAALLAAVGAGTSHGAVAVPPARGTVAAPAESEADPLSKDSSARELARLLVATDAEASSRLIDELHARSDSMAHLCATLFEPAARVLGDAWGADDCTEFEVTLGLCRLQTAVRSLSSATSPRAMPPGALPRAVLVAPMPGEMHALSATLDAELLWQANWDTRCEQPATDEALAKLLAGRWFDALDLSLSAAFGREHWLPRLTHSIAIARAASRNPALVVVVGGRAFFEQSDRCAEVGADAGCPTALQIEAVLAQAFGARA